MVLGRVVGGGQVGPVALPPLAEHEVGVRTAPRRGLGLAAWEGGGGVVQ